MTYEDEIDDADVMLRQVEGLLYGGREATLSDLLARAQVHALLAIASALANDYDRPTGPVRYDG